MKAQQKTEQINPEKIEKSENSTQKPSENPKLYTFPIIGIGASAGGIEALEVFFRNMPDNSGMAFVVIQHLDPTYVGIMPELMQRFTPMKVIQTCDRTKVKPNCVYIIPPNRSMSLLRGALHLFEPVEARGLRLPVDIFFRSLAHEMRENSIGIILSGMGSDGSLGVKAIKDAHGVVLVQDPATAKFDSMPRNAAEAVIVDIAAPVDELPDKLIGFLKSTNTGIAADNLNSENISNIEKIIILIREQTGHDFSLYKKNTIFRRIERRKSIHLINKIENYVRFLQENPQEIHILFKELLIGVTSFFRDTIVWDNLKDNLLPALMNTLHDGYVMRAWIPGCSTGEEAYSLAITFTEAKEKNKKYKNLKLQIFATDLDTEAIDKARKGYFSHKIAGDISEARLLRYFVTEGKGYRINTTIREMVVFAPQNVIKDPPFTKLDILMCRNMLIYMEPKLQKKLIALFNYSINPGGLLMLGTSESLGYQTDGFEEVSEKIKVFKRTSRALTTELIDFPSTFYQRKTTMTDPQKTVQKDYENIQTLADQILLQKYAPASVLVNKNGDILYITGRTGKYLEPLAGKANWNIYAMAREGLNKLLPGAFRKVLKSFDPVVLRNVKFGTNGGTILVDVTVQCIENPEPVRGMIIIVFNDVSALIVPDGAKQKPLKQGSSGRIAELEIELQRISEELQSTIEENQTAREEFKSINEELQSTNEELQSTNEELTTSKEEMQSLNEELQTVNIELQSKISDHQRANEDMTNLLNSIEIATLFLDKNLHIRRFTEQITKIFKLRDTDINRPFTDLVTNMYYPEMGDHARQVLKTLTSIETAIKTNNEKWFSVRIMPYRTLDDRIDGIVITFTDITLSKKMEIELKKANEELRKREKTQNKQ